MDLPSRSCPTAHRDRHRVTYRTCKRAGPLSNTRFFTSMTPGFLETVQGGRECVPECRPRFKAADAGGARASRRPGPEASAGAYGRQSSRESVRARAGRTDPATTKDRRVSCRPRSSTQPAYSGHQHAAERRRPCRRCQPTTGNRRPFFRGKTSPRAARRDWPKSPEWPAVARPYESRNPRAHRLCAVLALSRSPLASYAHSLWLRSRNIVCPPPRRAIRAFFGPISNAAWPGERPSPKKGRRFGGLASAGTAGAVGGHV